MCWEFELYIQFGGLLLEFSSEWKGLDDLILFTVKDFQGAGIAFEYEISRNMRKPTMWILTRSDTNQAVQPL